MNNPAQNTPSVGGEPSCTGTRDGRKVFCQRLLFSSQKGTQTQAWGRQPSGTATGQRLSVCPGRRVSTQPHSVTDNIIYQMYKQTLCASHWSVQYYLLKCICKKINEKSVALANLSICRNFQKTAGYIRGLFVKWYDSISECWWLHSSKWIEMLWFLTTQKPPWNKTISLLSVSWQPRRLLM